MRVISRQTANATSKALDISLTALGQLIARCWNTAEINLRNLVAQKYPASTEEFLTSVLAGELRVAVADASNTRKVEAAFLQDLQRSIHPLHFASTNPARLASGLIARVNLHDRQHEGKLSAADLGIVVMRPSAQTSWDRSRIEIRRDHATGLLAQAKLGRGTNRADVYIWDDLTAAQERLLPKRRKYYSLLLYRVNGRKANHLAPFTWQLCSEYTIGRVKKWLRSGAFPEEALSPDVLTKLFAGTIGTKDQKIIKSIIDPAKSSGLSSISIEVFWPDGKGPPPCVNLRQHTQERQVHSLIHR